MNKQAIFAAAYRAARQAAAGREIQAYAGESCKKAEAAAVWNAAYDAGSALVYMNGQGYMAVKAVAGASVRALIDRRAPAGKPLAERLDIYRRERAGEYICD